MSSTGAGPERSPVALDAMGGDRAPEVPVEAAVCAARELGIPVTLVGQASAIEPILRGLGGDVPGLSVVDAPEVVAMEEHAAAAVRRKSRASIAVAMEEVKAGRASAVVSAGNSGAVVAAALLGLGRLPAVHRPAIAIPFPALDGRQVLLLDAGAVVDPRPADMVQWAYLASSYLERMAGIANPRVGLLSNGEESGKGNALTRATQELLAAAPGLTFAGNIEAHHIPSGQVDAVVCDGFTGNVLLKTAEGVASLVQASLRAELTARWYTKILAAALRPALLRAAQRLDYREYGGAPLLGVRGVVIIAHGRSDSTAVRNAIAVAHRAAQRGLADSLAAAVAPSSIAGTTPSPRGD